MGLGVKRTLSETALTTSKKFCGSRDSLSDDSFGCADLDLTQVQLDLQSFTNNFLRQLGGSVGMHAAEDTVRLACSGPGGAVASASSWQTVSEQNW